MSDDDEASLESSGSYVTNDTTTVASSSSNQGKGKGKGKGSSGSKNRPEYAALFADDDDDGDDFYEATAVSTFLLAWILFC